MNKPHEIQQDEWLALGQLEEVMEGWGLEGDETPENLASLIYGVRFDYQTDGPGYVGPLFLLVGGGGPDEPPMTIIVRDDALQVVQPA